VTGPRLAILGATSHVAKNLIVGLAKTHQLCLFARSPERVASFVAQEKVAVAETGSLDSFDREGAAYDAVINCIGVGTPEKLRALGGELFALTERYDNAVLAHLGRHASTVYVNFSSGAISGTDHREPITQDAEFRIRLDAIAASDAYRISKLNAEAKHRACAGHSIIDLRLFNLFSRHIDLDSSYLATDLVNAVRRGTECVTNDVEIVRDFVHPTDLCDLVSRCVRAQGQNRPFDVYSSRPAKKSEIIRAFQERFALQVKIVQGPQGASPTGVKSCYASNNHAAETLGYAPRHTSIEALLDETQALLSR
jgi:nucleoside-diphosphate-sugar epimerase